MSLKNGQTTGVGILLIYDEFGQKLDLLTPKDKDAATKKFYEIKNKIIYNCAANRFDDSINFDDVIKSLV